MKIHYIVFFLILFISGCYGEKKTGLINNNIIENHSKKVLPGMISTYKHESSSTFSQDNETMYFSRKLLKNNNWEIAKK